MMPSAEYFSAQLRTIGVRKNDIIIVYDKSGMLTAPRTYWMLKSFGAPNVYILNGTFSKWEAEKRAVETGETEHTWTRNRTAKPLPDDYTFKLDSPKVKSFEDIQKTLLTQKDNHVHILDGRGKPMFDAGHIETALSLPFSEVLNADKTFKSNEELKKLFKEQGSLSDPTKDQVILSCQRGIAACVLDVALRQIGNQQTSVYDGSYEEYGAKIKLVAT